MSDNVLPFPKPAPAPEPPAERELIGWAGNIPIYEGPPPEREL